ncbi:MAG: DoxX family membrane protein [Propionibacterium sp.]|nr:DoxX family membrane protein [Propionibacterium sp.]
MSLLRFVARSMLASVYAVRGVQALRDPESVVPTVQPVADTVVPMVKRYAPAEVAASIPTDTATLVRLGGVAQLAGAAMLATGKGRRLGAALLAASSLPRTIGSSPFGGGVPNNDSFVGNVSLLGGVLLASQDTEGKPSLAWRAQAGTEKLTDQTRKAKKRITKEANKAKKEARKQAKAARKAITS